MSFNFSQIKLQDNYEENKKKLSKNIVEKFNKHINATNKGLQ